MNETQRAVGLLFKDDEGAIKRGVEEATQEHGLRAAVFATSDPALLGWLKANGYESLGKVKIDGIERFMPTGASIG